MDLIYNILTDSAKIIFFIIIIFAFVVSWFILFKPGLAAQMNQRFNRWVSTRQLARELDSSIDTTETILKYRWLIAGAFFIGALFTFKYLAFDFDSGKFIGLVIRPRGKSAWLYYEIAFEFFKWFLIFCSIIGMAACLIVLFKPEFFRKLNSGLNTSYSIEGLEKSLDSTRSLDDWVLKNHVAVGLFLFLGSCYLIVFFLFFLI